VLLVVVILGVLLCYVWFVTIRSYGQLSSGKFKVIYEVEKSLHSVFMTVSGRSLAGGQIIAFIGP